jgi:uncharacterized protein YbdZ (MbtH family)
LSTWFTRFTEIKTLFLNKRFDNSNILLANDFVLQSTFIKEKVMDSEKAAQEISFIKSVIERNRKAGTPDGIQFIIWGIIVFMGMLGNYFLIKSENYSYLLWMWIVLIAAGWTITMIISHKQEKKKGATNWAERIYVNMWLSAGITMSIIGFIAPFTKVLSPMAICPVIAMIMGTAHFISGTINDFKWQQWVGVLWWIGGIVLFLWVAHENFLLFGLLMILLQVIPGIKLNSYRKRG